jgi:hypothetical protein
VGKSCWICSDNWRIEHIAVNVHVASRESNWISTDEATEVTMVEAGPSLATVTRCRARACGDQDFQGFPRRGADTTSWLASLALPRARSVLHVKELRLIVTDTGDTKQRDFVRQAVRHGQASRPCHTPELMPDNVAHATGTHSRLSSSASGWSVAGGWGASGRRKRRAGCVRWCTSRSLAIETCV